MGDACLLGRSGADCRVMWCSTSIGNNRRPISCLQVWQQSLNPLLLSCKWKFEEDKKLLNSIQKYGTDDWVNISSFISSARTPKQCFERYKKLHHHIIKYSETKKHLLGVKNYNSNILTNIYKLNVKKS